MTTRWKVHSFAFLLIPAAIVLAGCAQQHSDVQAKEDKAAAEQTRKDIGSIDDARCQSFGFQQNSPRYAECREELETDRNHMGIKE